MRQSRLADGLQCCNGCFGGLGREPQFGVPSFDGYDQTRVVSVGTSPSRVC